MISETQLAVVLGLAVFFIALWLWLSVKTLAGSRKAGAMLIAMGFAVFLLFGVQIPASRNGILWWLLIVVLFPIALIFQLFPQVGDRIEVTVVGALDNITRHRLINAIRGWETNWNDTVKRAQEDIGIYIKTSLLASTALNAIDKLKARKLQLVILTTSVLASQGLSLITFPALGENPMQFLSTVAPQTLWILFLCAFSNISISDYLLVLGSKWQPRMRILKLVGVSWVLLIFVVAVSVLFDLVRLPLLIWGALTMSITNYVVLKPAYVWARFISTIPRQQRLVAARSLTFYLPFYVVWTLILTAVALYFYGPYFLDIKWMFVSFWTNGPSAFRSRFTDAFYPVIIIESLILYFILIDIPFWMTTRREASGLMRELAQKKEKLLEPNTENTETKVSKVIELIRIESEANELQQQPMHPFTGFNLVIVQILLAMISALAWQAVLSYVQP